MIAIGKPGMAHADAIRVNQSLIHQSQLLFGYGNKGVKAPFAKQLRMMSALGQFLGGKEI